MINFNLNKIASKRYIIRITFLAIIIGIFTILTVKYAPLIANLADEEYRMEFKNQISQMGLKGVFIIIGLQMLQTIVAILPGQPIELISGMLYGPFWGTVICVLGIFISVLGIFFMVRRYGIDFIRLFFKEEQIEKIRNSKLFKNTPKFEMALIIIFVLPIFPKDIFIYIAGISPIKSSKFIAIATLARIPGQLLGVYTGSEISQGSYVMPIIIFSILGILGILYMIFAKKLKIDKYNDFKDLVK